ncbi:MAG: hypothetical protein ABIJ96_00895 [Elusimicrobiota bacterium]
MRSALLLAGLLAASPAAAEKPECVRNIEWALSQLRAGKEVRRDWTFSEREANEALTYLIRRQSKFKVSSARLRLTGPREFAVSANAEVGDYLLGKLDADAEGLFGAALRRLLRDQNSIEVKGYFFGVKGMGYYKTRHAAINGHGVPDSWIRKLTRLVGRHQRPPVDFNQLFLLPPGIEKIQIAQGTVKVRLRKP